MERGFAVFAGVGLAVFGLVAGWNFVRDTREAIDTLNQPKNPWDEDYQGG